MDIANIVFRICDIRNCSRKADGYTWDGKHVHAEPKRLV